MNRLLFLVAVSSFAAFGTHAGAAVSHGRSAGHFAGDIAGGQDGQVQKIDQSPSIRQGLATKQLENETKANTTLKHKNPQLGPGGLDAAKAQCVTNCKEKYKNQEKYAPGSSAADQVLASAGTQEQKDAIKAKNAAKAENEAKYQACLKKCN